jgi:hypothetical protein
MIHRNGWGIAEMYSGKDGAYCQGPGCQEGGVTISGFLGSFGGNPSVGLKPEVLAVRLRTQKTRVWASREFGVRYETASDARGFDFAVVFGSENAVDHEFSFSLPAHCVRGSVQGFGAFG